MTFIAGLDLAAKETRPSGLSIAENCKIKFIGKVYYDRDILKHIVEFNVKVLAIDAPLSHAKTYRKVDLEMKRRGFKVLPPGWRYMRILVERAIKLKSILERYGIVVIETHPKSALKNSGYKDYKQLIKSHLILDELVLESLSKDEIDSLICLLVAYYYVKGCVDKVEAEDGVIYLLPTLC
ncbi:MAG TPA: DUF429 domain-containing protein [Desulfurococcales archaeon]|nr:DUF429 domain-containing protein [Desulfurococcales archaeon]